MVQQLLDFRARLDACVAKAFQGNEHFAHALKEAFEHFINQVICALHAAVKHRLSLHCLLPETAAHECTCSDSCCWTLQEQSMIAWAVRRGPTSLQSSSPSSWTVSCELAARQPALRSLSASWIRPCSFSATSPCGPYFLGALA